MSEVSTFRLYLLRGMYLFIAVGLALTIWPGLVSPPENLSHMSSVVRSVLGGVSLLALLGLRYPLRMLPLLLFELVWKSIWVLAFGVPLWSAQKLDANAQETMFACFVGIVPVLLVTPWGYVLRHYVKTPGDPWKRPEASTELPQSVPDA